MNLYYVVKQNMEVGKDGFYMGRLLATHPSRAAIHTNIVLYEGFNAKKANEVFRRNYNSYSMNNPVIYKGEGTSDMIVVHKVRP